MTGGAGFIGSHVVDALLAADIVPRILDLRPPSHHIDRQVEVVLADLLDPRAVQAAMDDCDAVIHLAAAADVDEVARRPVDAEAVNATGTINVLEAARRAGVARVVYASTIWVYAAASDSVDEESALAAPDHLYTATKLAGEMYCRAYSKLYALESTVLRFGIPYGPRARPAGVVPVFVRKALAGEPLTIAGEGLQSRRFVYVQDLAAGVVLALAPQAAGRVYNLVGDEDVSVRDVAETVRRLVGSVDIVHTPARAADFEGARVSGARAAAELGWHPETSFSEGVRRYAEWLECDELAAAAAVRPASGVRRGLFAIVRFAASLAAVVVPLIAYLASVHAVGLAGADERTVGLLSFSALAAYLASRLDGETRPHALGRAACWVLAGCAALSVLLPGARELARLGTPDGTLILLSLAGTGLSVSLGDAAVRMRRGGRRRRARYVQT